MSSHHSRPPLAIVSMACRLPGGDSLNDFWQMIRNGGSAIGELPPDRLDQGLHYDSQKGVLGKTYSRIAGLVGSRPRRHMPWLDPAEAEVADPTHLNLLEVAIEAIERAGWDPGSIPNRKAGVFIGHTRGTTRSGDLVCRAMIAETSQYLRELPQFEQLAGNQAEAIVQQIIDTTRQRYPAPSAREPGSQEAHQAARLINLALGLDGPYLSMNSACASSLYALSVGAMGLWTGELEMAIVGGASYCKVESLMLFSKAGSVSATGSRPFDDQADGFVTAEGYAVIVLKTLQKALADGDRIEAVIRGVGVSSDGKGKSLWAPRHEGQIEAIRRAYGDNLRTDRVQYLEAHATSTPVGDATEMMALMRGIGDTFPTGHRAAVGSVKANIGHTLETAGLAGLIKTVLALQAKEIPPTANVVKPNPKIDWANAPFDLPNACAPWPTPADGKPRRAGVNAFGIGGLNAHVVIDEYVAGCDDDYFQDERIDDSPTAKRSNIRLPTIKHVENDPIANDPIAIIGMGAILPGAMTWQDFWKNNLNGISALTDVPEGRFRTDCLSGTAGPLRGFYAAGYQYDWKKHKVAPKQVQQADPLQFMMLDAVDQALRHSGYAQRPFDRKRTGVIVGSIFGGEFGSQLQMGFRLQEFFTDLRNQLLRHGADPDQIQSLCDDYTELFLTRMPAIVDETGSFTSSTLASRCTKTFDLMGGATAIDCSRASGLAALHLASLMLRTGNAEMMIVAAGQRSAGHIAFQTLLNQDAYAAEGRVRPLLDPGQTIPGEGVGAVILKRHSSAVADGDPIHALIHSIGAASGTDTRDAVLRAIAAAVPAGVQGDAGPEESNRGRAMRASVQRISLVEVAADGVAKQEREILAGLDDAFRGAKNDLPVHLRTVADATGSLGGATSMVSVLRAAESVNQQRVAPLAESLGDLSRLGSRSLVLADSPTTLPAAEDGRPADALAIAVVDRSLCFTAIISSALRASELDHPIEKTARADESRPQVVVADNEVQPAYHIVRFGGDSISELLADLEAVSEDPAAKLCQRPTPFRTNDRFRIAIVARDAAELASKIQPAWRGLQMERNLDHLAVQGIFIGQSGQRQNRLAFCFPGQGSQYANMFYRWAAEDRQAADSVRRLDETLHSLGLPSFAHITVEESDLLGVDIFRTQLAVLLGNVLMLDQMKRWNVRPDVTVGHSFGEFAALLASGVWDARTAIRATQARCDALVKASPAGTGMTSLLASAEVTRDWVQNIGGQLWVANRNAPEQTVVGGTLSALQALEDGLRQQQIKFKRLSVPAAFHTPLMSGAQSHFEAALAALELHPPQVPLVSTVTGRLVNDPAEIRALLVRQLVSPVCYQEAVQRLVAEGVYNLVEVGPSQVLSGLNRRIAADQAEVIALAMDQPRQNWRKPLAMVRALVEVNGLDAAKPSLDPPATVKFAGRKPEPAVHAASPLVPVLQVGGSRREMGRQYGEAYREDILDILSVAAGSFGLHRKPLPDLSRAVAQRRTYWADEDWDELLGVAEGAGVAPENVAALNYWLYPDIDGGCAHFIVPSAKGTERFWHGANEDLPLGTILGGPFPHPVVIRHPNEGIVHTQLAMIGQIGSITGMNAAGLSLSSSMLLDRPLNESSSRGRLHGLLVADVLRSAQSIEDAIAVIRRASRRGAWGILLADAGSGQRLYLEYDGAALHTSTVNESSSMATNHSQLLPALTAPINHSIHRLERLAAVIGGPDTRFSLTQTQRTLRDRFCNRQNRMTAHPTMDTLRRIDNQTSLVLAPHQSKVWVAVSSPTAATPDAKTSPGDRDPDERPDDHFVEINLSQLGWRPHGQMPVSSNGATFRETQATSDLASESAVTTAKDSDCGWLTPAQYAPLVLAANRHQATDGAQCDRFVNRMVFWPADQVDIAAAGQGPLSQVKGDFLVAGDGVMADAIEQRLASLGLPCTRVRSSDAADEELLAACRQSVPRHLILTAGADAVEPFNLSVDSYQRQRRAVDWTFRLCQQWYRRMTDSGGFSDASCVAVQATAGDFGLSGHLQTIASGAVAGLVKAIRMETFRLIGPGLHAQIVDIHPQVPVERAAVRVLGNLAARRTEMEVGYDAQQRRGLLCSIPGSFASSVSSADVGHSAISDRQRMPQAANGAWLVTGGARGVTAAVVQSLGKRFCGPLHLIGASPLPDIDPQWLSLDDDALKDLRTRVMREAAKEKRVPAQAWARIEKALEILRNLQRMKDAGIECHYWSCDVSDHQQLADLIGRIRQLGTPIVGVIHGAGFEKATKFATKKWPQVQQTIDAKADGCANLMALTSNDPLRYFVSFGSISGRFGGIGQTDYCLANELQAKLACWYAKKRPNTRVVNIAWHAWDEVGMAARPETRNSPLLAKMVFMSVREGVNHLLSELDASNADPEVTITDWNYYKRFHPDVDPALAASTIRVAKPTTTTATNFAGPLSLHRQIADLRPNKLDRRGNRTLTGQAVILSDHADSRAVATQFQRLGVTTTILDCRDPESARRRFDRLLESFVPEHLVLASPRDDAAWYHNSRHQWQSRLRQDVWLPAEIVRAWLAAATRTQTRLQSLSALLCLGGDFGMTRHPLAPQGAGLSAMLRQLADLNLQRPGGLVTVKVLDAPIELPPASLAEALVDQLRHGDEEVEIAVTLAGPQARGWIQQPSLSENRQPILSNQTWIALLGNASAGLALASQLASRWQCNLHLIGDATCQAAMGQSKFPLHQVVGDDRESLQAALCQVRDAAGPLAGVLDLSGLAQTSASLAQADPVIAILRQLDAQRDLIELTRQDPIQTWFSCGKVTDPGFAGRGLLLQAFRSECPEVRVCRVAVPDELLQQADSQFIDAYGDFLTDELANNLPHAELRFAASSAAQTPAGGETPAPNTPIPGESPTTPSPVVRANRSGVEHHYKLDAEDKFLREHRFRGKPLMPLVVSVELLVRAALALDDSLTHLPLQMRGIRVLNRLPVEPGTRQAIQINVSTNDQGVSGALCSDLITRSGQRHVAGRRHVEMELLKPDQASHLTAPPVAQFQAGLPWFNKIYRDKELIYHGQPFRALKAVSFHATSVWGTMTAPDPDEILGRLGGTKLWTPMVILDAALFLAGISIWRSDETSISLPLGIDSLTVWRVPEGGEQLVACASNPRQSGGETLLDVTVWDSLERRVLFARDYRCATLRGPGA